MGLLYEIQKAKQDYEIARRQYETADPHDRDLIDAAIYKMHATEAKYSALLHQASREQVTAV